MGGRIWVESRLGQGSTFHFTGRFPLVLDDAQPKADEQALAGMRVLVVDDNPTNRRILAEMLASWGMSCHARGSAREALLLLEAGLAAGTPYQLLLTDVHMPDVDGLTLAEPFARNRLAATAGGLCSRRPRAGGTRAVRPCAGGRSRRQTGEAIGPFGGDDHVGQSAGGEPGLRTSSVRVPSPRLRILLAEDSLMNQKLVLGLLGAEHAVTVAYDGKAAVGLREQQEFDVVLMDVQMPVLDGLEATRRFARAERNTGRHVPIVAMTAHAMKGDRERCLAAGMDYYVSKPIRAARLFEALRGHDAGRSAGARSRHGCGFAGGWPGGRLDRGAAQRQWRPPPAAGHRRGISR